MHFVCEGLLSNLTNENLLQKVTGQFLDEIGTLWTAGVFEMFMLLNYIVFDWNLIPIEDKSFVEFKMIYYSNTSEKLLKWHY